MSRSPRRSSWSAASARLRAPRPPGHHAAADFYGGYCFLNNAAIAAQAFATAAPRGSPCSTSTIHHGNGTQAIFYERADVLTLSIHGDPGASPTSSAMPTRRGAGEGEGYHGNLPLPRGTEVGEVRARRWPRR